MSQLRWRIGSVGLAAAAWLSLSTSALGLQPSGDPPARDPDAMAALDRMGTALRNLRSFAVRADVTREEVLTTGQKLQFGGRVDMQVSRPNGFRIDMESDRQTRSLYYDGRSLTLYSPRLGYYATADAPPTIAGAVERLKDDLGVELPLADLFTWGAEGSPAAGRITSAFRVGTETIGGVDCEQYALRQDNVDWQIWLRPGAQALPCKLVITTTDDPSMPQYTALFTWQANRRFAANAFVFSPPTDSRRIRFGQVPPEATTSRNRP